MTMRARLGLLAVGLLLAGCSGPPAPSPSEASKDEKKRPDAGNVSDAALVNGQPSLEALGQAVVEALNDKDGPALMALTVPKGEYERRLFGAVVGDPAVIRQGPQRAWVQQDAQSRGGLAKALREHGGKGYVFKSLQSTDESERRGVVVHRNPRLTVADAEGKAQELTILGMVVEHTASKTVAILTFSP